MKFMIYRMELNMETGIMGVHWVFWLARIGGPMFISSTTQIILSHDDERLEDWKTAFHEKKVLEFNINFLPAKK